MFLSLESPPRKGAGSSERVGEETYTTVLSSGEYGKRPTTVVKDRSETRVRGGYDLRHTTGFRRETCKEVREEGFPNPTPHPQPPEVTKESRASFFSLDRLDRMTSKVRSKRSS